ncbi:MAG: CbtA family protein, partial [Alphaproteobacteria bacterium]
MFKRIAIAALVAGILGGVVATLAQGLAVWPLIFEAETYEIADAAALATAGEAAEHGMETWSPADGLERTAATAAANVVAGVGFALLLGAAFALSGRRVDARRGLLWG